VRRGFFACRLREAVAVGGLGTNREHPPAPIWPSAELEAQKWSNIPRYGLIPTTGGSVWFCSSQLSGGSTPRGHEMICLP